ncbi:hypothetical protein [Actinoplanes auranticolor]|uniref:Uncharacterized protein n=1 Tax=Actinoplanes auranticolor TaxID=47988 RepID=A0A919VKQ0_9ACTN|nr:hypothetical protein [Actinoplanes auranticolor]GIM66927.1 hypothetical protein Aau02nite_25150 [Actinoplanes auranticolor]
MVARPPRSILALTEEIIEDRAPRDVPILSVVSQAFYEVPAVRRKMAATVEAIYRRQSPTAFDASDGSLVLQLTLVLLNGAATGAFDDATVERGRPVADWLARRRLSWRLRRRRAAQGADTPIPALPPVRASQIAGHARRLAGRCGLTEAEAEMYAGRLVSVLEEAPV